MIASIGPSAYWYLTRSTGAVAMVLLTVSVVLGVIDVRRFSTPRWPRFVVDSLHRTVSLLVVVFLVIHILTAALDSFAPIALVDAVVPFVGSYRPFWLGLGALSFDLIVAVVITSILRQRVGYRVWRAIHWAAYASWPVALVHGLGTGSDVKSSWLLALSGICLLAVLTAIGVRVVPGWPDHARVRGAALALAALVPIGLAVWLPGGPLGQGWARRSGTPASLLPSSAGSSSAVGSAASARSTSANGQSSASSKLDGPFRASLSGSISSRTVPQGGSGSTEGFVSIKIATTFTGPPAGHLDIEIEGPPTEGGGVTLTSSRVTLGDTSARATYSGRILALNGTSMVARVARSDGRTLSLRIALAIDPSATTVSGTLAASPVTTAGNE